MLVILLNDMVDAGFSLSAMQGDMLKLVVHIVVTVETFLCPYPESTYLINKEEGDDITSQ